jgi:hypothetical protein
VEWRGAAAVGAAADGQAAPLVTVRKSTENHAVVGSLLAGRRCQQGRHRCQCHDDTRHAFTGRRRRVWRGELRHLRPLRAGHPMAGQAILWLGRPSYGLGKTPTGQCGGAAVDSEGAPRPQCGVNRVGGGSAGDGTRRKKRAWWIRRMPLGKQAFQQLRIIRVGRVVGSPGRRRGRGAPKSSHPAGVAGR